MAKKYVDTVLFYYQFNPPGDAIVNIPWMEKRKLQQVFFTGIPLSSLATTTNVGTFSPVRMDCCSFEGLGGIKTGVPLLPVMGISEIFISAYLIKMGVDDPQQVITKKPIWCKSIPIILDPATFPALPIDNSKSNWNLNEPSKYVGFSSGKTSFNEMNLIIQKEGCGVVDTNFKNVELQFAFNSKMTDEESKITSPVSRNLKLLNDLKTNLENNIKGVNDCGITFTVGRVFRNHNDKMPLTLYVDRFYNLTCLVFSIPKTVLNI